MNGNHVADVCGGPDIPDTVATFDVSSGAVRVVRTSLDDVPDRRFLPRPRADSFVGVGGRDVHAFVYPPSNPDFSAPEGERPPYVAFVHGGPTAHSDSILDLVVAYFTSRGIGVVDVNYGGSSGYGRRVPQPVGRAMGSRRRRRRGGRGRGVGPPW